MTNTVLVGNISIKATERDLWEFFAFSGEIQSIQIQKTEESSSQSAYVTFLEEKALETALLLTGAVIIDRPVTVDEAPGYKPPVSANTPQGQPEATASVPPTAVSRAEDVVANLLAKGYILSKDAAAKARSFDEKHQLSTTAAVKAAELRATAVSTANTLDRKMGLSQKVQAGATVVNQSLKSVDEKYKVVDTSRAVFTTAEQRVNDAAAVLMKNSYVASSATWLSNVFGRVVKVAEDVNVKTKEKVREQTGDEAPEVAARTPALAHPDLTLVPPETSVKTGGSS